MKANYISESVIFMLGFRELACIRERSLRCLSASPRAVPPARSGVQTGRAFWTAKGSSDSKVEMLWALFWAVSCLGCFASFISRAHHGLQIL